MPRSSHHIRTRSHGTTIKRHSLVEKLIYVVAIAEPLANLPQIFTIYHHKAAQGVSISSWVLYALFALTWLWYGLFTRQRPMIVAALLFFATDCAVLVGAVMYGGRVF